MTFRTACARIAMSATVSLVLLPVRAEGHQALVRAAAQAEFGQAWLFTREDRCYALTPHHVVQGSAEADLMIAGKGTTGYARGVVAARWPDVDLALLEIASGDVRDCGPLLVLRQEIGSSIRQSATGEIRQVDSNGGLVVHMAEVVQLEDERLGIRARNVPLVKSFSGSVFYISGSPIGMLTDVTAKGVGILLRMDEATGRALDHLTERQVPAGSGPANASPGECDGASGTPLTVANDLAAARNGGRIVAWTGLPEAIDAGPANLLTGCAAWAVADAAFPVSVTIELGRADRSRLTSIALDATAIPPDAVPDAYEIFVRTGAAGSWRSVAAGRLSAGNRRGEHPLARVLAKQVMVRIYGSHGGRRVSLRAISVIGQ